MSEPKRARRRRDLSRMKAKARRIYPHDPLAKLAEHLHNCSCWMCGNPRRVWKMGEALTRQEQFALADLREVARIGHSALQ